MTIMQTETFSTVKSATFHAESDRHPFRHSKPVTTNTNSILRSEIKNGFHHTKLSEDRLSSLSFKIIYECHSYIQSVLPFLDTEWG